MRSATSFCNPTLYRKTVARFWPMWAAWGAFWLFVIPMNLLNRYFDRFDRLGFDLLVDDARNALLNELQDVPYLAKMGTWLTAGMAVLCAMAVFGYLYNNRSACMMHSLPLTRDTLFTTQYLAGLSFLLVPVLVVFLAGCAIGVALLPAEHWGYALEAMVAWVLGMGASSLFFFSFAAFCAMFTGHILALPAFYGILNILVYVMTSLVSALMDELFFGYRGDIVDHPFVMLLTPIWAISEATRWQQIPLPQTVEQAADLHYIYHYELAEPLVLALYAVVGVVLTAAALWVYRRRHVESAGDVVSIPVVRPFFRWGVAVCAGLCLGCATAAFFGWSGRSEGIYLSVWVIIWSFVGWFAAEMLLKKSFRVWKCWKGGVVMAAAMALLCACLCMDWFGVETRVPDPRDVSAVSVSGSMGYPYDSGSLNLEKVTDEEIILLVTDLHRAIVADRARCDRASPGYKSGEDNCNFSVTYTLKDGTTLRRRYSPIPLFKAEMNDPSTVTGVANRLISDRNVVETCYNLDYYRTLRLNSGELRPVLMQGDTADPYQNTIYLEWAAADLSGLWQAVQQDFAEGTLGVRYLFDDAARRTNTYRTDLELAFAYHSEEQKYDDIRYSTYLSVTLTPNARHTLNWLEEMSGLGTSYELMEHDDLTSEEMLKYYPEEVYVHLLD